MKTEVKKKLNFHIIDCMKILIMVVPPIHASLVVMLFRILHLKYHFTKRRHSKTLATKLQTIYGEV